MIGGYDLPLRSAMGTTMLCHKNSHLKGTPSQESCWPENDGSVPMFPFVGFIMVGLSIPVQQKPHFCCNFELLGALGSASAIEPVKIVSVYGTPQLKLYQCT